MSDEEFSKKTACSKCQHVVKPFYGTCPKCEGDKNRRQVEQLAEVIREFKDSISRDMDPERERLLTAHLDLYGHPDPRGFLNWLSEARRTAHESPRKKARW